MKDETKYSDPQYVRRMFNEMADEYDDIRDLWYGYLFESINRIIEDTFRDTARGAKVLDVGCGTGEQTLAFARLGADVVGFDIADRLVDVAVQRLYDAALSAELMVADATTMPFRDEQFDIVNCCGSTLSFIPDYELAVREMSRVLRPGGLLLLDAEQKWTLDLIWEAVSSLGGDFLHYDTTVRRAFSHFSPPLRRGYYLEYPFHKLSGELEVMRIRLFTISELEQMLHGAGIHPEVRWGLHVITNLIPSTTLHSPNVSKFRRRVFNALAHVEKAVYRIPPVSGLGNTVVILGQKRL